MEGNRKPPNLHEMSHSPLRKSGYTCAPGGTLNTEFDKAAGSRLDNLNASPPPAPPPPTASAVSEDSKIEPEEAMDNKTASLRLTTIALSGS